MWADRGDHDRGYRRVHHGGSGRHRVGRATRGRRDDEAITLDRSDEFSVQVQIDVRQVGGRSTVGTSRETVHGR